MSTDPSKSLLFSHGIEPMLIGEIDSAREEIKRLNREISRLTAELPPVIGLTENAEEIAKRFDPLILAKWYLQAEYWRKHWHREMMLHAERIHNQRAEIGRLTAELEEARKDAARYRWLLNNYARGDGYTAIDAALNDGEPDSQLSQAIDAAMTKEKL